MHLIIVADAARARFLTANEVIDELVEVLDLLHPQAQLRAADLYTDSRGRRGLGSAEPHTEMRQVEQQVFARDVAAAALQRVDDHERLIVVAPPRFLGVLRRTFDPRVIRKIVGTVAKDISQLSIHELPEAIRRNLSQTAGMP